MRKLTSAFFNLAKNIVVRMESDENNWGFSSSMESEGQMRSVDINARLTIL